MNKNILGAALALSLFAAILPSSASAGAVSASTVVRIDVHMSAPIVYFTLNGTVSGTKPGCVTAGREKIFGFRVDDAKGQAMLSLVTSAFLSGKKLGVAGTGYCVNLGNSEDVGNIWLVP